jgi:hypothetical protein
VATRGRRVIQSVTEFEAAQARREVVSHTAVFLKNLDIPFLKFVREFCVTLLGIVVLFGAFGAMGVSVSDYVDNYLNFFSDSKSTVRLFVPGVRIPLSPPKN